MKTISRCVRSVLGAALLVVVSTSCSGGGPSLSPLTQASPHAAARGRGTIRFTIKVPLKANRLSATIRRPNYISASTQSLTIAIDGGSAVAYNLTTSSPNCAAGSGTIFLTCTLGQAISAGAHAISIVTYDQQNGTGNVLSQNTVAVTIAIGQVDDIPIVLNGVIASLAVAIGNPQIPLGVRTTVPLGVNGYDADQNLIIGPGSYASSVTVTDSDASGATTLSVTDNGTTTNEGSTATILDPTAVVGVVYGGQFLTSASFSASSGSIQTSGVQNAVLAFVPEILHVVIIVQENRSFDNLFNGFPGANTVQSGLNSSGQTITLQPEGLVTSFDPDHSHYDFGVDFNNGLMNGFNQASVGCSGCTAPANAVYSYVPESDAQPYWTMAGTYALADDMFESNEGPSVPAHMYLSFGSSAVDSTNTYYAMGNPQTPNNTQTSGCDSPAGTLGELINPATNDQSQYMFPCFDHQTLWDLLDSAGISWKWYQPSLGAGLWFTPDAIKHIRYGPDYANVSIPNSNILGDIANGNLPGVSWVIPTADESDHASETDGSGPAWVSSVVNAIGNSNYWGDTAIFITWDDWGGWYDHVPPPQYNYFELGFRVPLIVVSPYTRAGYVSHVQHEFGSLLHFTEEKFQLGSLGTTDVRADDLSDMFNFSQTPLTFSTIAAPAVSRRSANDRRIPDKD